MVVQSEYVPDTWCVRVPPLYEPSPRDSAVTGWLNRELPGMSKRGCGANGRLICGFRVGSSTDDGSLFQALQPSLATRSRMRSLEEGCAGEAAELWDRFGTGPEMVRPRTWAWHRRIWLHRRVDRMAARVKHRGEGRMDDEGSGGEEKRREIQRKAEELRRPRQSGADGHKWARTQQMVHAKIQDFIVYDQEWFEVSGGSESEGRRGTRAQGSRGQEPVVGSRPTHVAKAVQNRI